MLSGCKAQKGMTASQSDRDTHNTEHKHCHSADRLPLDYRSKIVEEAESWIGTPYKYAQAEKGVGSDCSGMVMKVYETVLACKIPRNSALQAEFCIPLEADEAMAGDLVFFATGSDPDKVTHVGIIEGDGNSFVHVSSSKGAVISKLSNNYYASRLLKYGRVPLQKVTAAHQ